MTDNVQEAGESAGGVKYLIKRSPLGNLFSITTSCGGQLPEEFKGMFTSPTEANCVIDAYLARGTKNVKGSSR